MLQPFVCQVHQRTTLRTKLGTLRIHLLRSASLSVSILSYLLSFTPPILKFWFVADAPTINSCRVPSTLLAAVPAVPTTLSAAVRWLEAAVIVLNKALAAARSETHPSSNFDKISVHTFDVLTSYSLIGKSVVRLLRARTRSAAVLWMLSIATIRMYNSVALSDLASFATSATMLVAMDKHI